jgi:transposase
VEKLFACPTPGCQIDVNADLNASVNLHRRFYGGLPNVKKNGDAILIDGRTTTYQAIEHDVLHRLRAEAKWLAHAPNAELDTYERAADALF